MTVFCAVEVSAGRIKRLFAFRTPVAMYESVKNSKLGSMIRVRDSVRASSESEKPGATIMTSGFVKIMQAMVMNPATNIKKGT